MKQFLLLFLLPIIIISCSENSSNTTIADLPEKYTAEEKKNILNDMKKVMVNYSKDNPVRDIEDAKSQIQSLGMAWYLTYGKLIEAKWDEEILRYKDSSNSVLGKYQRFMFPKYREAFAKEADKKLWIEDCSAFISGENNEVLNLVGVAFAPNRTKQESFDAMQNNLKRYRFKKLTFRTFKSSTPTEYDISSDSDGEYIPMDF